MNKQLQDFDDATDSLAEFFVKKYFGKEYLDDYFWIGSQDEDREVLAVSDFFFSLSDIVSFIRYKYTEKEMFKYYDYALENRNPINIQNWKKLKYEKRKKKPKIK